MLLNCDAETAKAIIVKHINNIYLGRRNFHFLFTNLVEYSKRLKISIIALIALISNSVELNNFRISIRVLLEKTSKSSDTEH